MPREHIEGNSYSLMDEDGHLIENPNSSGLRHPWRVEIGWDKDGQGPIDGSVRIATTDPNIHSFSKESGLWIDLGRDQINDLIRLLRKARDQAYGRDE